jgi:hypothetical protein
MFKLHLTLKIIKLLPKLPEVSKEQNKQKAKRLREKKL